MLCWSADWADLLKTSRWAGKQSNIATPHFISHKLHFWGEKVMLHGSVPPDSPSRKFKRKLVLYKIIYKVKAGKNASDQRHTSALKTLTAETIKTTWEGVVNTIVKDDFAITFRGWLERPKSGCASAVNKWKKKLKINTLKLFLVFVLLTLFWLILILYHHIVTYTFT